MAENFPENRLSVSDWINIIISAIGGLIICFVLFIVLGSSIAGGGGGLESIAAGLIAGLIALILAILGSFIFTYWLCYRFTKRKKCGVLAVILEVILILTPILILWKYG